MKIKIYFTILPIILALISACVNLDDIVINTPDLSKIADGKYRGDSKVGPVRVTLDVTMESGVIASMQITRHLNGRGKKAEAIVPRVIEAQSLNVDVISGATGSSKAILQAAENALTKP
ncbi:MAG: FMN-binding protein [Treponema sp.]|jgi:uncharacterized protein with FMN-binding domain|nr:FMN-binding protein [Treponema sp.]